MFRKVLIQVIFWVTILVINLAFMAGRDPVAGILELLCVVLYATVFYTNILWLFPRYYESNRIRYIFYAFILVALVLFVISSMSDLLYGERGGRDERHHGYYNWLEIIMTFRHVLWLLLVFLAGTVYSIQKMLTRQTAHHKKVMEEKLQTELQLLKAQINPHFLFNALNNIYSLTYMKSF